MKDIPGYEERYAIDEQGRLWSHARKGKGAYLSKGKWKETSLGSSGYPESILYKHNKYRHVLIHRLVAEAFIPNPDNLPQVNHKNGVKTDNRVQNLEWCTHKENNNHAYLTGLQKNIGAKGSIHSMAKLTEKEVLEIRSHSNAGSTYTDLAKKFGISTGNVSLICRRKTWKHI